MTCTSASPLPGDVQTRLQQVLSVAEDASGPEKNIATASTPTLDPSEPLPTTVDEFVVEDEGVAS